MFGWKTTWNHIEVDVEEKKLVIRRGWGANKMKYSLDGWTGRYGMPLEFLLSVHIATMKPDLAYEMAKSFNTDIKIIMQDASNAEVQAAYEREWKGSDNDGWLTFDELDSIKSEGWFFMDSWFLSNEEAQDILRLGIKSPVNCSYKDDTRVLIDWSKGSKNWMGEEIEDEAIDGDDYGFDSKSETTYLTDINRDIGDQSSKKMEEQGFSVQTSICKVAVDKWTEHLRIRDLAETYGYPNSSLDKEREIFKNGGVTDDISIEITTADRIEPTADNKVKREVTKSDGEKENQEADYYMTYESIRREWYVDDKDDGECQYTWITFLWQIKADNNELMEKQYDPLDEYYINVIWKETVANLNNKEKDKKCYEDKDLKECCEACRRHVKTIIKELGDTADGDFDTYVPYIERVTDHWFRDVYFELTADEAKKIKLSRIDLDYEKMTNERWTEYETYDETHERAGEDKLYRYDASKEDGIGELYDGTLEEAQEEGVKVIRKQVETYAVDLKNEGTITLKSDGSWSAYEISDTKEEKWTRAFEDSGASAVQKKVYYKMIIDNNVVQTQDGLRGVTNARIKDMFLNRYYFSYDGTTQTAEIIQELRNKLADTYNGGKSDKFEVSYGHLKPEWLDDEYTVKVTETEVESVEDEDGNSSTSKAPVEVDKKVKVGDYASKVEITIDSLGAFTILENTHTLDADFIYKDFKELIVELGYFDKEELSDYTPQLLQFLVPTISSSYGYPIRNLDKNENEYGTFIHSKLDYELAQKEAMARVVEEANANRTEMGNGLMEDLAKLDSIKGTVTSTSTTTVPSSNASVTMSDSDTGTGKKTGDITINGITYEAYWQEPVKCTLYAYAFIAQAYGDKSAKDLVTNSPYWSDSAGFYWNGFANSGVPGTRITSDKNIMYEQTVQALSQGKPVFFYSSFQSTGGYHAVVLLGTDSNGNILYYDPWGGTLNTYGNSNKTASENLKILFNEKVNRGGHCVYIPNEAPPGTTIESKNADIASINVLPLGTSSITPKMILGADLNSSTYKGYTHLEVDDSNDRYVGYEGGEAVVSPVTGILLEYGVYDDDDVEKGYRMNVDKKGVTDKVGYAKILVLNDSINKQITTKGDNLKGLDVFTEEYENAHIAGFMVYIDGFKCEAPTASGTGKSDIKLDMDYFKSKAASASGSCSYTDTKTQTLYVPDPTYELSNAAKSLAKKTETENKNKMVPLYKFNASINEKTEEVLIIKEGTVIGRTYSNEELSTELRGDSVYDGTAIQGNYLRIIMRNNDDEVVENIEDYMKLGETAE